MKAASSIAWLLCGISLATGSAFAVDGDVALLRKGQDTELPPAVFPHWTHRIRYTCSACHPDPFTMQAGSSTITMEAIAGGEFCGRCHNGTTTWGVAIETCNRCHTGISR